MKMTQYVAALCLAAAAASCAASEDLGADGQDAIESNQESVASSDEAAGVEIQSVESALASNAKLYHYETFKVRGWVAEEVHREVLPRDGRTKCSRDHVRDNDVRVIHRGNGGCGFDGWVSPNDPTDCRARIWVKRSAGGDDIWNGTCEVSIFEKPILTRSNSCVGRCGGSAPACECDPLCLYFSDCCADFQSVCMAPPRP